MPTHHTVSATNIEAVCANVITAQIFEMHTAVIKELSQINAALNRLAPESPVQTETLAQPIPLREPKQLKSRRA
jgi:hypothetical protein